MMWGRIVAQTARGLSTCRQVWHAGGVASKGLPEKWPIFGVKHVVLVSSAKGGVGKSTTSVNLALGLKSVNPTLEIGLLDADVFGPSIPTLMNLSGRPELDSKERMVPLVNYGIKCMSMGFLVNEEDAMIWRGPMVMSAIQRLLRRVAWGELDVLVVDMPPGTGDTQLSISQNIPVSGAVVVSTPQELALKDARRGIAMFQQVDIPLLGVVQNMAYFECPCCGTKTHVFGKDGVLQLAKECNVDILGNIPLTPSIQEMSDQGRPMVIAQPESTTALEYRNVAQQVLDRLPKYVDPFPHRS
eukprot:m.139658 g.139658  ORF g.139658 m.139658 type:complete len:300 (-) comp14024_c1_seq2:192-1091(-)